MFWTLLLLAASATPDLTPACRVEQDPELEVKLEQYEEVLASREDESRAIALMEEFTARWKTAREEWRKIEAAEEAGEMRGDPIAQRDARGQKRALESTMETLADAVEDALTHRRRKQVTEANLVMWRAAAACLSRMEEAGADRLWEAFDERRFHDEPDLRGEFLVELGRTKTYRYVGELIDLLDHEEMLFIAKAAEALAEFGDAPGKVRHAATERLVKLLAESFERLQSIELAVAQAAAGGTSGASEAAQYQRAQERYRRTAPSMTRALEALTGKAQDGPLAWRRWFNKHKRDKEIWGDD